MNELIEIKNIKALEVFSKEKGLDCVIEEIRQKATDFDSDLTTDKGRKHIASMSHKVSKCKVALEKLGKDLVVDWKKKAKLVDSERIRCSSILDELRDEVRKPLTEWENAEKLRVDTIKSKIKEIYEAGERSDFNSVGAVRDEITRLDGYDNGVGFQEFRYDAQNALIESIKRLKNTAQQLEIKIKEKEELESLRKEAEILRIKVKEKEEADEILKNKIEIRNEADENIIKNDDDLPDFFKEELEQECNNETGLDDFDMCSAVDLQRKCSLSIDDSLVVIRAIKKGLIRGVFLT